MRPERFQWKVETTVWRTQLKSGWNSTAGRFYRTILSTVEITLRALPDLLFQLSQFLHGWGNWARVQTNINGKSGRGGRGGRALFTKCLIAQKPTHLFAFDLWSFVVRPGGRIWGWCEQVDGDELGGSGRVAPRWPPPAGTMADIQAGAGCLIPMADGWWANHPRGPWGPQGLIDSQHPPNSHLGFHLDQA